MKIVLDFPYSKRAEVMAAGAKYSKQANHYYASDVEVAKLLREYWQTKPPIRIKPVQHCCWAPSVNPFSPTCRIPHPQGIKQYKAPWAPGGRPPKLKLKK